MKWSWVHFGCDVLVVRKPVCHSSPPQYRNSLVDSTYTWYGTWLEFSFLSESIRIPIFWNTRVYVTIASSTCKAVRGWHKVSDSWHRSIPSNDSSRFVREPLVQVVPKGQSAIFSFCLSSSLVSAVRVCVSYVQDVQPSCTLMFVSVRFTCFTHRLHILRSFYRNWFHFHLPIFNFAEGKPTVRTSVNRVSFLCPYVLPQDCLFSFLCLLIWSNKHDSPDSRNK